MMMLGEGANMPSDNDAIEVEEKIQKGNFHQNDITIVQNDASIRFRSCKMQFSFTKSLIGARSTSRLAPCTGPPRLPMLVVSPPPVLRC